MSQTVQRPRTGVFVRARGWHLSPTLLDASAVTIGALAAVLATGYFDDDNGRGAVGGVVDGLYGATVAAPLLLVTMVAWELSGDRVEGLVRDAYLSGVRFSTLRLGAVASALRQWARFLIDSILAAACVGFGAGIRAGDAIGNISFSAGAAAAVVFVPAYAVALGVGLGITIRSVLASVASVLVLSVGALLAVPIVGHGWGHLLLECSPYGPLIGLLDPGLVGRFGPSTSLRIGLIVACVWSLGVAVSLRQSGWAHSFK